MSWNVKKNQNLQYVFIYGGVTLLSMVFTTVYYTFSHGLRDYHLSILSLPPAIVMTIFLVLLLMRHQVNFNTLWALNTGFCFIWLYYLLNGIYAIAKTSSNWLWIYLVIGSFFLLAAIILEIVFSIKGRKKKMLDEASNDQ